MGPVMTGDVNRQSIILFRSGRHDNDSGSAGDNKSAVMGNRSQVTALARRRGGSPQMGRQQSHSGTSIVGFIWRR